MTGHLVHPFDDDRFIAGNATAGLEILEDLPDVDAIVAPLGGGGLLAGIAAAVRALKPDTRVFAAEPETAAPLAASLAAGRPLYFRQLAGLVRRRRRRQVRAADDVAAARGAVGLARRLARRGRARHEARGRAGAGDCRRPPPAAPSPRRSAAAPVRERSSPSCRAATSIWQSSPPSSAHVTNDRRQHRPPLPPRIARLQDLAGDLWWSWHSEARVVFRTLDYGLWRGTSAQSGAHAAPDRRRQARAGGRRSGISRDLRLGDRRARRRARRAQHLVDQHDAARRRSDDRLLLRRVRAAPVAADLRPAASRARRRSLQGSERPRRAAHRRRLHVSAGPTSTSTSRRRAGRKKATSASAGATRRSSRR